MTGGIPNSGDGDGQGSILVETSLEESKAPFAVQQAQVTTSGLGEWARTLTATVPLNHAALAGVALGVLFLVGIFVLAGLNNDAPGVDSPSAGAAGSDDSGSRGRFTDGGLFASDAPKKRSRAAGAAGKEAALAEQSAGRQATSDDGQQALDDPPAGPAIGLGAELGQLGPSTADDDDEPEVNTGATNPRNTARSTEATGSNLDPQPSTTVRANNPGGPLGPTTTRPTIASGPPTTGMTSASIPTVGQTTIASPTTGAVTSPAPTSSSPPPTPPPPTEPAPTTTSTTNPPVDNTPLIAAPSSGSMYRPNARITFVATAVTGADRYCWTLSGAGVGAFTQCASSTASTLSLGDHDFGFGSVTVVGEARSGSTTLKSGSITIVLRLDQVLSQPRAGATQKIGRTMRIGFREITGADQYCYQLQQTGYDPGEVCMSGTGVNIGRNDPLWDELDDGPLRVSGRVMSNGSTVGSESVTITLTD